MVHQVVGESCETLEIGRKLYKQILQEVRSGREVELDFSMVQVATPSFFNASLGYLLRDYGLFDLIPLVKASHLEHQARKILTRVVENAKIIYQR